MYNIHRPLRELHFPEILGLRARKHLRSVVILSHVSLKLFPFDSAFYLWSRASISSKQHLRAQKKLIFIALALRIFGTICLRYRTTTVLQQRTLRAAGS